MEQVLIITGSTILGILGTIHLVYTFFTNKFEARDPAVTQAMRDVSPILTRDTSVWRAWIGFNASHSLGVMFFAGIYIPLAFSHFTIIQQSHWFTILPVVMGSSYLLLARKYWFKIPFTGILIATICFIAAAILVYT
jgi:hypothetical protein